MFCFQVLLQLHDKFLPILESYTPDKQGIVWFSRLNQFKEALGALCEAHSRFAARANEIAFGRRVTYTGLAPLMQEVSQTLIALHGAYMANMPRFGTAT